jgi:hypothetical protein
LPGFNDHLSWESLSEDSEKDNERQVKSEDTIEEEEEEEVESDWLSHPEAREVLQEYTSGVKVFCSNLNCLMGFCSVHGALRFPLSSGW